MYVSEADGPQDPLDQEVRKLSEMLEMVKDEQGYIVLRERTHRNTAESTNARVKWWNLFVIGIVIGESVFQVWWLRRFFEVCHHHHPRFLLYFRTRKQIAKCFFITG